jgi:hypothetical protein
MGGSLRHENRRHKSEGCEYAAHAARVSTDLANRRDTMRRGCVVPRLAILVFAAVTTAGSLARAEPPPPVDVVLREPPPRHRAVALEYNPLALIIGKLSANVVIVPGDHHALVVSPYYTSTTTAPISLVDASGAPTSRLPQQTFQGFGGELGYRYYFGLGGPRGAFVGPSLLVASMDAKAENGTTTSFLQYGVAADAGFAALVADAVSITVGGGVQYAATSVSIPNQQFPANVFANQGVWPRLLLSLGWAF